MTVAEVLKQSGLTDEQIAALDAKAMSAFSGILTTADQAKADAEAKEKVAKEAASKAEADKVAAEASATAAKAAQDAAELANRNVADFWATTYPAGVAEQNAIVQAAVQAAETARINAEAKTAWLQAQVDGAKAAGITLADAPDFVPPAKPPVADPNKTPGTPTFVDPNVVVSRVGDGMYGVMNIMHKYATLYNGQPLPISPSELIKNADALKLSPMEYAARTFKFAEKEEEQRQAAARKHDEEVASKAVAEKEAAHKTEIEKLQSEFNAKEKLRAEQNSTHPDFKLPPGSAKFTDLQRAVKAGERPDPTKMTQAERRQATLNNIHKSIEERDAVVA
jgi:hypothetical protein